MWREAVGLLQRSVLPAAGTWGMLGGSDVWASEEYRTALWQLLSADAASSPQPGGGSLPRAGSQAGDAAGGQQQQQQQQQQRRASTPGGPAGRVVPPSLQWALPVSLLQQVRPPATPFLSPTRAHVLVSCVFLVCVWQLRLTTAAAVVIDRGSAAASCTQVACTLLHVHPTMDTLLELVPLWYARGLGALRDSVEVALPWAVVMARPQQVR